MVNQRSIKKTIIGMLMLSLLLVLFSCQNRNSYVLKIHSVDYPQITKINGTKADKVTSDEIKKLKDEYAMSGYYFDVSLNSSNELVVSNHRGDVVRSFCGSGGYVVGFSMWEFMSGVYFYNYIDLQSHEPQKILDNQCIAFLHDPREQHATSCYAITTWDAWSDYDVVRLYKINFPYEINMNVNVEKICDVTKENDDVINREGALAATITDDGLIYIVTSECLYEVTTGGNVSKIDVPEAWPYLIGGSIVYMSAEKCLYIGSECGILKYDIVDKQFVWFQAPYSKLVD